MPKTTQSEQFASVKVILIRLKPSTCQIKLLGELDHISYAPLYEFIQKNILPEENAVVLDMEGLAFMDSSGLQLFEGLMNRFGLQNVAISSISWEVYRIFEITGLLDQLIFIERPIDIGQWEVIEPKAA